MQVLGIDVGGSGIKGALVDTATGVLATDRLRLPTPEGATPSDVAGTIAELTRHFQWTGIAGCGLPAVVLGGVAMTAANIDRSWIGTNAQTLFEERTSCRFAVANDADAAGIAEMRFGAGKGVSGVVIVVTLGTGIGTAVFVDGKLVPNTELGHLELDGKDAERLASDAARERDELSWRRWAKRVDDYLDLLHRYFWPELIIVGGGVSRKHDKFLPRLTVPTKVVPAEMRNEAGVVGAAMLAVERFCAPTTV